MNIITYKLREMLFEQRILYIFHWLCNTHHFVCEKFGFELRWTIWRFDLNCTRLFFRYNWAMKLLYYSYRWNSEPAFSFFLDKCHSHSYANRCRIRLTVNQYRISFLPASNALMRNAFVYEIFVGLWFLMVPYSDSKRKSRRATKIVQRSFTNASLSHASQQCIQAEYICVRNSSSPLISDGVVQIQQVKEWTRYNNRPMVIY